MNSYSENLHSSVLASLESQEMSKKKLDSQLNSSMFTLYYAEGAEIIANDKLASATKKYNKSQKVKEQAVKTKNISTNIVMSSTQQNSYTSQSVSNLAVSASNIQIATNAIVRLASDMGSIFSIINAADYGTQIYQQSIEAYNLMNRTAYLAEVASQHAMEASACIAEVASSTVEDKAKATDTSIDNLLKIANTDFTNMSAVVATENDAKAAASVNTKAAQGVIESNKVELEAAKVAYNLNNKRLNYNLRVRVPKNVTSSYDVAFDYYKAPFGTDEKGTNTPELGLQNPVKSYNLFLVKDSKKSIFSTSAAEDLMGNVLQHVQIIAPANSSSQPDLSSGNDIASNYNTYFEAVAAEKLSKEKLALAKENLRQVNAALSLATKEKNDADEHIVSIKSEITKLTKEVASAKEKATAATEAFKKEPKNKELEKAEAEAKDLQKSLEQELESAKQNETKAIDSAKVAADSLKIATTNVSNAKTEVTSAETKLATDTKAVEDATAASDKLKREGFASIGLLDLMDSDNEMVVLGEKYVIFLFTVFTDEYKKGINTYDDYLSAPSETFSLQKTLKAVKDITVQEDPERRDHVNPDLPTLKPFSISFPVDEDDAAITEYRCMFLSHSEDTFTNNQLENLEESIEVSVVQKEMQTIKNEIIQYTNELVSINEKTAQLKKAFNEEIGKLDPVKDKDKIAAETSRFKNVENNYNAVINETDLRLNIAKNKEGQLNMALERILAKKVPEIKNKHAFFFNLKLAENIPSGNYSVAVPSTRDGLVYEVKIDPTTTDNFGNALIDSKPYIPVVVSIYKGAETNKKQYISNISDWENEDHFTFSIINNK
ncbi:hypothetical protein [Flavobacterium sp. N1736]|uniref:hypothetical protein n=1 Tax=Flavobacterium sp. N1736 TaxID=2986823 RepID=UPI00222407B5|nr:hypothetical protein [Flavobacterium sp. N1736]